METGMITNMKQSHGDASPGLVAAAISDPIWNQHAGQSNTLAHGQAASAASCGVPRPRQTSFASEAVCSCVT